MAVDELNDWAVRDEAALLDLCRENDWLAIGPSSEITLTQKCQTPVP